MKKLLDRLKKHVITYKSSHHKKQKSSEEDEKSFLKKFLTRTKQCDKIQKLSQEKA